MKFQIKNIWLSALSLLAIVGCSTQAEENKTTESSTAVAVKTKAVVKKIYQPELIFDGTVFAAKEANLGSSMPGRVEKLWYKKGDRVKKGDLLVSLSSEMLTTARIEYNTLKKDMERVERLKAKGSISLQDYDHVKARYDASAAKVEMLTKNTQIRAPFSGVIVDYLVQEGENFMFSPNLKAGYSMTSGIVRLMDLNHLIVKVNINEKDLSTAHKGMPVIVKCDAYPQQEWRGKISTIEPTLNTRSRTAVAEISLPAGSAELKPGMYARAYIQLPADTGIFIPNEAIIHQKGTADDYVYVVRDNKAVRTIVKTQMNLNGEVLIEGLQEQDLLITKGKNKLSDGMPVSAQQEVE